MNIFQVVLKIIKHCQEQGAGGTDMVQGVLLGLVEGPRLEVTNCFPFPSRYSDEEDFNEGKHFYLFCGHRLPSLIYIYCD